MSFPVILRTLRAINSEIGGLSLATGGEHGQGISLPSVATLSESVAELQKRLEETSGLVDQATEKMRQLRDASGLDEKDSAVSKLSSDLRDAQDRLQYLKDTRAGEKEIAAQSAAVEKLRTELEEAQRLARIAKFEFEQSPAFKAQRAEIEAAKAEAERTKKALDEERKKLVEQKKAQEEAERQKRLETEQSIEESTKQSVLTLRSSAEASAKKIEDATERAATLIKRRSDEIAADFDAKVKALGDLYTVFGQKLSTLFGVLTGALGGREGALGRDPREYAFLEDVIRKTIEQILLFGGANTRGLDPDTFRRLFEDYLKRQQKKSGNTSSQPKPSTSLTQQSTQGFLG